MCLFSEQLCYMLVGWLACNMLHAACLYARPILCLWLRLHISASVSQPSETASQYCIATYMLQHHSEEIQGEQSQCKITTFIRGNKAFLQGQEWYRVRYSLHTGNTRAQRLDAHRGGGEGSRAMWRTVSMPSTSSMHH